MAYEKISDNIAQDHQQGGVLCPESKATLEKISAHNLAVETVLKKTQGVHTRMLNPLVKWAGGKEQELKYIIPNLPEYFENYYEPFVGGGSVYTSIHAKKYFINDKSHELIDLYKIIVSNQREEFFTILEDIVCNWEVLGEIFKGHQTYFISIYKEFALNKISEDKLSNEIIKFIDCTICLNINNENFMNEIEKNVLRKTSRMRSLEKEKGKLSDKDILDNIETALKSAFYMHLRHIYNFHHRYQINGVLYTAIFLFIRNFAYSGMFRYNLNGEFNVPYGGIAYNNKNFRKKIEYLKSEPLKQLLSKTAILSVDFQDFFNIYKPNKNDFVFLDPPYDTEFSTYAKNSFTKADQQRLADYLIYHCDARWMLIIKNTDFILNLYSHANIRISTFEKTYLVSFMNRNNKEAEHLLITNY